MVLCVLTIPIAFVALGLIILVVTKIEQADRTTTQTLDHNRTGCGANSFQIRDGVCDQTTNTKICLFDGGDCCLEEKITNLCKVCTCKLAVDKQELNQSFAKFDVKRFVSVNKFQNLIERRIKKVVNVLNSDVCSLICLDKTTVDFINSWIYDGQNSNCVCTMIDATFTSNDEIKLESVSSDSKRKLTKSFVQMSKILKKGCMNLQITVKTFDMSCLWHRLLLERCKNNGKVHSFVFKQHKVTFSLALQNGVH